MALFQKLEEEMKVSLKSKDTLKLSVIRMLLSSAKMLMIEKGLKVVDDPDMLNIIQKSVKQHKDSIAQFEKGNRRDLADKELKELAILESYMPKQMSEAEIAAIVKEVMVSTGLSMKSDKGKVMKAVLEKTKGRADNKMVNDIVTGLLK